MITPQELSGKRVLYGCLDWGMGHVSRSIPLIAQLTEQGNEVTLWCSPEQEQIFRSFSLQVNYVRGFERDFRFTGDGNFYFEMFRNAGSFAKAVKAERRKVEEFVASNRIEAILSDHRYSLHAPGTLSIFITHQCKLPQGSGFFANLVHKKWISRFDGTWIMDDPHNRLAGELSAPLKNSSYIGHFSRFSLKSSEQSSEGGNVAIISGPIPYSQQFFQQVLKLAERGEEWKVVCPAGFQTDLSNVQCIHDWKEADKVIQNAKLVISRCGYSTLMDLKLLGKPAILIPTKGQLEQEYFYRFFLNGYKGKASWKIVKNVEELSKALI